MIAEHYYTIMVDEQVKMSTDDFTFFICVLFDDYSKLEKKMDVKEIKKFKWTIYRSSDDRILIHFVTK